MEAKDGIKITEILIIGRSAAVESDSIELSKTPSRHSIKVHIRRSRRSRELVKCPMTLKKTAVRGT